MEKRWEAHRTNVYYVNRGDAIVAVLGDDDQGSSDGVSCGGNVNIDGWIAWSMWLQFIKNLQIHNLTDVISYILRK